MRKTPLSTYRVQMHAGFDFEDAAGIADYLSELGVSHLYSSPYLQTAPGSTHGYDVTDFKSVNQELGGAAAHERFCKRLGENGLGQILDIVPNHMSLAQNNPYWLDVLENGRESKYAEYFDIDWDTDEARLRNKLLLPLLENQYGLVLRSGAIQLVRTGTRFEVTFGSSRLPITASSMSAILGPAAEALRSDMLSFIADAYARLALEEGDDDRVHLKLQRDRRVLFSMLDDYLREDKKALGAVDEAVAAINANTDALDNFLQLQHYRLAYWRAADQDLGYRRFFDINSLIGVRVERARVFLDTHELILGWLRSGIIDGVRVDHADGLRDPQGYFERLREQAPDAWIVAEKILARNEALRDSWPIEGTTGYDFLNQANGLLISPDGLTALDEIYQQFLGTPTNLAALIHEKKVAITVEGLGSDVNRLTSIFVKICEAERDHRDHTRAVIRHALREIASCFSVYRSYVSPDRDEVPELDAAVVQTALDVALQYRPDLGPELFGFLADVMFLRKRGSLESDFLLRFQQFTSPVMAKGYEDTALYCYNRLIGMNEVGSNLGNPIVTIEDFHRFNMQAQDQHPLGMVTLSTHDTKRGEDMRARLAVLSEIPSYFGAAVARWTEMNKQHRTNNLLDRNTEYFYYQTLIGAWPLTEERAIAYMEKAAREAKERTSWTLNDVPFENELRSFIRATIASKTFCAEVQSFVGHIEKYGRINSLAQTLLKNTVPGVPDLYQGSELWDYRLVDPDNRRPVDFELRKQLLSQFRDATPKQVLEKMADGMEQGLPKLWTVHQALAVRQQFAECFDASGSYTPLFANGEKSNHVVAFFRGQRVVSIVPRLSMTVADDWLDTSIALPKGRWKNVLTGAVIGGGSVLIVELLSMFPVALLTKEE